LVITLLAMEFEVGVLFDPDEFDGAEITAIIAG
jgi:hypothetical protein